MNIQKYNEFALSEAFNSDPYPYEMEAKSTSMDRWFIITTPQGNYRMWFEVQKALGPKVMRIVLGQALPNQKVYKKIIQNFKEPMKVVATMFAILREAVTNDQYVRMQEGLALAVPKSIGDRYDNLIARSLQRALQGTQFEIAKGDVTFTNEEFGYRPIVKRGKKADDVFVGKEVGGQAEVEKAEIQPPVKVEAPKQKVAAPVSKLPVPDAVRDQVKSDMLSAAARESGNPLSALTLSPIGGSLTRKVKTLKKERGDVIREEVKFFYGGENALTYLDYIQIQEIAFRNPKEFFFRRFWKITSIFGNPVNRPAMSVSENSAEDMILHVERDAVYAKPRWEPMTVPSLVDFTKLLPAPAPAPDKPKPAMYIDSRLGQFGIVANKSPFSKEELLALMPGPLLALRTDDFQNRGGRYPSSDKPDTIDLWHVEPTGRITLIFTFKDFSGARVENWVKDFLKRKVDITPISVVSHDGGDYAGDWTEVYATIQLDMKPLPDDSTGFSFSRFKGES